MLKACWPPFVLVLLIIVFFYPVVFFNKAALPGDFIVGVYYPWLDYKWGTETGVVVKNPITTDVVSFIYPMQMLAVDLLKNGQLPLWNPYILTGTPLLANFQSAPFSPTNFVYFLFEKLTSWNIQIILQHILASLFTYVLLRHWKISKIGAIFGGIIFSFSGFNLIWSQWNGHTLTSAFIPLVLYFSDKWFLERKIKYGFLLSVSLGLQILSGYPQAVLYTLLGLTLLWVVRIFSVWQKLLLSILFGVFILLGFGIASFQLLPGFELISQSQRSVEPHPYEWAFLPWEKIITFLAPDYFGNHSTQNYWGPQDYTSNTGFVGVIPAVFAMLGLSFLKRRKEAVFCLFLLVFSLLLSFPTFLSVLLWKSGFLGFQAASAHRALVLFNLNIAILAGLGIDRFLQKDKVSVLKALLLPGVILLGFSVTTLYLYLSTRSSPEELGAVVRGIPKYSVGLRNLVVPLALFMVTAFCFLISDKLKQHKPLVALGLILFTCFELFRFGWKFTPFSNREYVFPQTPVLSFLQEQEKPFRTTGYKVVPINLRMPYKIETVEGYDAVYPLRVSQFLSFVNSDVNQNLIRRYATMDNIGSELLSLINTKYALSLKYDKEKKVSPQGEAKFDTDKFSSVFSDRSVQVLENKESLPRALMFYGWEKVEGDNMLNKLTQIDFSKKLVLEEDVFVKSAGTGRSGVEYLEYEPQFSKIRVSTESDGLLFISDTWYPGWKAFVDGHETKIYRADYAFRGILVGSGEHIVEMTYKPESFSNGVKLSGISLMLLMLLFPVKKYILGSDA